MQIKYNERPKKLNGHSVIAAQVHPHCVTVMVHRPIDSMPYVVATWWPELGTTWCWGHYCRYKAEADVKFNAIKERNEGR